MTILLFGVSNVGKTTTGQLLAKEIGYTFYDLDEEIKSRLHITLEVFVNTVWPYERDKIRGKILEDIIPRPENKVIAATPIYYSKCFNKFLARADVTAVELQMKNDPPAEVVRRLIEDFDLSAKSAKINVPF